MDLTYMTSEHGCTVAVYMPTYNHEPYIAKAIEGVLMQQTDFPVKVIISEDLSTDRTREICRTYREKYPEKIELILARANTRSHIRMALYERCFNCGADYIAMCEGDDYWTDAQKLQKQVDFLEGHRDFTMCQHRTRYLHENEHRLGSVMACAQEVMTFSDILSRNIFQTAVDRSVTTHTSSFMFRAELFKRYGLPPRFTEVVGADHYLQLWAAFQGKIRVLNDVMSVYRVHDTGASQGSRESPAVKLRAQIEQYKIYQEVFPSQYSEEIGFLIQALELKLKLHSGNTPGRRESMDQLFLYAAWMWKKLTVDEKKRVALYGTGEHTRCLIEKIKKLSLPLPTCILNDEDRDSALYDIPVYSLNTTHRHKYDVLALSSSRYQGTMREKVKTVFGDDSFVYDFYESYAP
jgi:glycosyltransferase involved in cell wall biosynthesis